MHDPWQSFLVFLQNPSQPIYPQVSTQVKWRHILGYFFKVKLAGTFLILFFLILGELAGLYDPIEAHSYDFEESLIQVFILYVALGPIIEEGIFRYFLGKYRSHSFFPILYYVSSCVFGAIHLFNFKFGPSHTFFMPLISLPFIFAGLVYGFIRITYGFWYAVGMHMMYNLILILMDILTDWIDQLVKSM